VVDTRTGRVVGFEALVRLNHPVLGLLSAAEFLTVAEQSDVIADIGAAVIEDAVREAVAWGTDIDGPWVSVNVSPRQLGGGRLTSLVRHLLEDYRLPATRLVLEVTEQAFMVDRDAIDDLVAVDRLGVRLALDDFGTGQSRLTHLHDLPLSIVKIDGEFVSGLGRDPSASALVRSIVTLGRSLGLMTVAEGVETGDQLDVLRHIGCDFAQGWLWSPAIAEPQALITGPDEPPPYAGLEVVLPR
jgi:EAL domain-containing protein (putative c-di-GMP-specific phosphodiesterase class I)